MPRLQAIRRYSFVALAVTALMGAVGASVQASATGVRQSVSCTSVTGNSFGPTELFSCSGATGGSGQIEPYPLFVAGTHTGTISWSLEGTTHVTTRIRVRTQVVTPKQAVCPVTTYPTELKVSGKVRADTSGVITVGGPVSATLCRSSTGAIVLLAGKPITIG